VYAEAQIYEQGQLIGRADTRRLHPTAEEVHVRDPQGLVGTEREELVELRRRIQALQSENDSLKRAAAHQKVEAVQGRTDDLQVRGEAGIAESADQHRDVRALATAVGVQQPEGKLSQAVGPRLQARS
jgi:hypothetical protein